MAVFEDKKSAVPLSAGETQAADAAAGAVGPAAGTAGNQAAEVPGASADLAAGTAGPACRNRATRADAREAFDALTETIWRLRQPDGCPWDRAQTHESIAQNMIEEAYEAVDCIEQGDEAHLREELGDVLMQVMLHAQIAADAGAFTIEDVVRELNEKLVRRHPHVFGDAAAGSADEVLYIWDRVKRAERAARNEAAGAAGAAGDAQDSAAAVAGGSSSPQAAADGPAPEGEVAAASAPAPEGLLDSVPKAFPALMQAQKVSKRAAKAGFEWDTVADVWDKVAEERAEYEREELGSPAREMEFGDMLFALVNVARKEGIDAEAALRASTQKFRARWKAVEAAARARGAAVEDLSTDELNRLWDEAKAGEKAASAR